MLTHMGLAGPKCLLKEPVLVPPLQEGDVDWSQFAYVQYVTNPDYLCNSVMLFEALHRLGSKADRLLMYPSTYSMDKTSAYEGHLLLKARDEYNVTLVPVDIMSKNLNFSKPFHALILLDGDIDSRYRTMGQILHQASSFQPNLSFPAASSGLRLHATSPSR